MSPEYKRWELIPKDLRQIVEEELRSLSWSKARAINEGVAWLQTGNAIALKGLDELSPGQRADA